MKDVLKNRLNLLPAEEYALRLSREPERPYG